MARRPLAALATALGLTLATLTPALALTPPQDETGSPTPVPSTDPTEPSSEPAGGGSSRFIITPAVTTQSTDAAEETEDQAERQGTEVAEQRTLATGDEVVVLKKTLSEDETQKFISQLSARPGVLHVEVDQWMKPTWTPNDPQYNKQWDLTDTRTGLNVPPAWDRTRGRGAIVAVLDTGIVPHEDLDANRLPGYDFISNAGAARDGNGRDADPNDEGDWVEASDRDCGNGRFSSSSWHGSHVAGSIAAVSNNGRGIAGIAPEAKILPIRVLGKCGGYSSDIIDGMLWSAGIPVRGLPANPNPADVINMSLGSKGQCSRAYQSAINEVTAKGTTVVVAAGNSSMDVSQFSPGNCRNIISVASNGKDGSMAYYSNYGQMIDVMAPGGDQQRDGRNGTILSTVNAGQRQQTQASYGYMQGTSMAAPHVAGAAAMVAAANQSLSPAQIEDVLVSTARRVNCPKGCGSGIVDVAAAVRKAGGNTGQPGPNPTPRPTVAPDPGDSPAPSPEPSSDPTERPDPKPDTPVVGSTILNGSFEDGAKNWRGDVGVINNKGSKARSGNYKAWLIGYGRQAAEQISQPVSIPTGKRAATLSFALQVTTEERKPYAYDKMVVRVFDFGGQYLGTLATFSNVDKTSGYEVKTLDLSQYIGQQIQIQFGAVEDRSLRTSFLFDDVTLEVS